MVKPHWQRLYFDCVSFWLTKEPVMRNQYFSIIHINSIAFVLYNQNRAVIFVNILITSYINIENIGLKCCILSLGREIYLFWLMISLIMVVYWGLIPKSEQIVSVYSSMSIYQAFYLYISALIVGWVVNDRKIALNDCKCLN